MGSTNFARRPRLNRSTTNAIACQHANEEQCALASTVAQVEDDGFQHMLYHERYDQRDVECLSFALLAASEEGRPTMVDMLITRGANVNCVGGPFETPLQAAILGGNEAIVERLLQCGAAADTESSSFGTPLQLAAAYGDRRILSALIKHGANVNQVAGPYHTALQIACVEGQVAMVRDLLEHGADANINGGKHGNAVQAAALVGSIPLPTSCHYTGNDAAALLERCKTRLQHEDATAARYSQIVVLLLDALQET